METALAIPADLDDAAPARPPVRLSEVQPRQVRPLPRGIPLGLSRLLCSMYLENTGDYVPVCPASVQITR